MLQNKKLSVHLVYDKEVDVLTVDIRRGPIVRTEMLLEGRMTVARDKDGNVLSIEIPGAYR